MATHKIGILTYFWAVNPGTFLQAYSMLRAVQRRFPDSRVELANLRLRRAGFHFAKRDINPSWLLKDYRHYAGYRSARQQHMAFSSEELVTVDYGRAEEFLKRQGYDLIIVGADTCLELSAAYTRAGQIPIYWLPPTLDCRKVIFSASAHALEYDTLDERIRDQLRASIEAFELVGVRDEVTWNLMKALGLEGSEKLCRTPDPTVTYEIDYGPIERRIRADGFDTSPPAIGLMSLPPKVGRRLADHYRSKGYQIVSLTCDPFADWSPWAISPFEWVGIFRYFAVTVTERFHGTTFSLKNLTPVVAFESKYVKHTAEGMSKRLSLLKQFGLEANHLDVHESMDFEKVLATIEAAMATFDRQAVSHRLDGLREDFFQFLERVGRLVQ